MKSVMAILMTGAAGLGIAAAQTAPQTEDARAQGSSWTMEVAASWSSNYRRLPDLLNRFDVDGTTGDVDTVVAAIDPPSNTIVSASLNGTSFLRKDRVAGFVTGSLRLGSYIDGTDLDRELVTDSTPAAPYSNEPDAMGNFSTFGFDDPDTFFIEPNIVAAGTVQLSENGFFLDGSALARQQSIGATSAITQQSIGNDAGTSTSVGGTLSPYFYRQWDERQQMELRLRGSVVEVVDENIGDNITFDGDGLGEDDQFANNSYLGEVSGFYDSGNRFGRYAVGVSGFARTTREDGSDNFAELNVDYLSARLAGSLAVTEDLRLTAGLGVDDISVDVDGDDTAFAEQEDEYNGLFWDVGLEYSPSQRFDLALSAGQRFGGPSFQGEMNYALTSRTTIFAEADTSVDTGTQQFSSALNAVESQASSLLTSIAGDAADITASLVGRILGVTGVGQGIDAGLRQGAFVFERYTVGLVRDGRRMSFSVAGSYEQIGDGDDDSESYSFSTQFSRRMSRRLTFTVDYDYSLNEGLDVVTALDEPAGLADIKSYSHFAQAGVDYALGRRLSAVASVYYAENNSENAGASLAGFDFEDSGILIGLRYEF